MNVANQISSMADKLPRKRAVVATDGKDSQGRYRYVHYTFEQLERRIDQFGLALQKEGLKKGDKVLLFIKPCLDFSAVAFALFKLGAIPVFIDPGMGLRPFLRSIENCRPDALIGIPKVFALKFLFRKWFKNIRHSFVYSESSLPGAPSLIKLADRESGQLKAQSMGEAELAAILFTSGGTGRPKGVEYTHSIFIQQTRALQKQYNLTKEDVDVPGFPLFGFFTLSMGMTSVIPDMDPSNPAKADPRALAQIIQDQGATFAAGSPAIWGNLARYCRNEGLVLPGLKYLVMFGAPISVELHESFSDVLPDGDTYTPYGATESLPVANATGSVILKRHKEKIQSGSGVYVGAPFEDVNIKIIRPADGTIGSWSEAVELAAKEVGEIIVSSPTTTAAYFEEPEKTREAKLWDDSGRLWHRMGDMGYLDEEGQLWFCGRKAHVVLCEQKPLFSVQVEAPFNRHSEVKRSALIEVQGKACLAIERNDQRSSLGREEEKRFLAQLKEIAREHGLEESLRGFYLFKAFPVDVRHNIKIDRKRLGLAARRAMEE